jgi:hypothetical protein
LTIESQDKRAPSPVHIPVAELQQAAQALRALHRALVASVQVGFEKLHGRVRGPGALLQLVLDDPLFTWLRPMSLLITQLDELLDDEAAIDPQQLAEILSTLERWTSNRGEGGELAANYLALLQTDPDVVMAHAALDKQLARLSANTQRSRKETAA